MAEFLGQEFVKELIGLFFCFFIFLCGAVAKYLANLLKEIKEHNQNVDRKLDAFSISIDNIKKDSDETDKVILRALIHDRIERVKDLECISREYYNVTLNMRDEYHAKKGNGLIDKEWGEFERKALCHD